MPSARNGLRLTALDAGRNVGGPDTDIIVTDKQAVAVIALYTRPLVGEAEDAAPPECVCSDSCDGVRGSASCIADTP